jgi:hypothetical protein
MTEPVPPESPAPEEAPGPEATAPQLPAWRQWLEGTDCRVAATVLFGSPTAILILMLIFGKTANLAVSVILVCLELASIPLFALGGLLAQRDHRRKRRGLER